MSDMSDTPPKQQLTVTPTSRGVMPQLAWLAWCQECELKQPFNNYDHKEQWVSEHRKRYGHRVQSGAGKR